MEIHKLKHEVIGGFLKIRAITFHSLALEGLTKKKVFFMMEVGWLMKEIRWYVVFVSRGLPLMTQKIPCRTVALLLIERIWSVCTK